MARWTTETCEANGIHIHYLRTGGSKSPIVLLHGLMTNGACWTPLAEALEELPYNHDAIQWTQRHFDPTFSAKWIPKEIPTLILSGSEDTPLKLFSQKPEYHRSNISMIEIENAGHFPWIENPLAVTAAFNDYVRTLKINLI